MLGAGIEGMKIADPTTLVVFGVTGDLSRRKLLPAIFDLYQKGLLPKEFRLVGFGRRPWSKREWQDFMQEVLGSRILKLAELKSFIASTSYVQGTFDQTTDYVVLKDYLNTLDQKFGVVSNKLFYLAVPPNLYETILQGLGSSQLIQKHRRVKNSSWQRILLEKPFGWDLQTSRVLDKKLNNLFTEQQIFRIDHYLAKETLQNILSFRFANPLFSHHWDRRHISRVEIKLLETLDVKDRGVFYDATGAIRDVGQNHLLQMLALVALEKPDSLTAEKVRQARARVLEKVKILNTEPLILGQYRGFRQTPGVKKTSTTETYFKTPVTVNNQRWRGVPFYLEAGKALGENQTEIKVDFKPIGDCLCGIPGHQHANTLSFQLRPKEGIVVEFWAKQPGFGHAVGLKRLSFTYGVEPEDIIIPDAYERLIHDALIGDQTLFASTEEVRACWRLINKILKIADTTSLFLYSPGKLRSKK